MELGCCERGCWKCRILEPAGWILVWVTIMIALALTYIEKSDAQTEPIKWRGIVVHITDSTHMTKEECDAWHRERGWDSCGYSFVIDDSGDIYEARGFDKIGAHTLGRNEQYLGLAFVTKGDINQAQLETFRDWHRLVKKRFGATDGVVKTMPVYPHSRFNKNKACPGEKVWRKVNGMEAEKSV